MKKYEEIKLVLEPPLKKQKLNPYIDDSDSEDECQDDIEKYIKYKYDKHKNNNNILKWWEEHSKYFPTLTKIARYIHCIPASSAPSERIFSLSGFILNSKRTRMKPSTLNDMLYLNSHFKQEVSYLFFMN